MDQVVNLIAKGFVESVDVEYVAIRNAQIESAAGMLPQECFHAPVTTANKRILRYHSRK